MKFSQGSVIIIVILPLLISTIIGIYFTIKKQSDCPFAFETTRDCHLPANFAITQNSGNTIQQQQQYHDLSRPIGVAFKLQHKQTANCPSTPINCGWWMTGAQRKTETIAWERENFWWRIDVKTTTFGF
ncbi:unnamed protein product [Ceratitis capitata]|uniref:(Mediterranean fruit fly) hypothetical protein n=1 Tax=Ceratitis capitata TaxID=7213 RepID=A0A811UWZ4_CERCA|nr:unnamed protein product [Ceratitis capitata]